MLRESKDVLLAAGHEVQVSDLYEMRFDPVSDRRNFTSVSDPLRLNQQAEESYASRHNGFVPELRAEMDKVAWCELLIFQFPIWWLGMPAILKGWVDRVFAVGQAYGGGRFFANGVMAGKRAMCTVTVGGLNKDYDGTGAYESIDKVLYPIHRGILAFTGFSVLPPFIVYSPARIQEAGRQDCLMQYRRRLTAVASEM